MAEKYDALLLVSFGGPECQDDVLPFLENVLRGKNVPRERMMEVVEHYRRFGGVSPINEQNRQLLAALRADFASVGLDLPIYWGNRNWHPYLPDALREMRDAGVKRALAFFTSAFSSYSGCRQYRENIQVAQAEVGEGAPIVEKVRVFFNHPGFVDTMVESTKKALENFTKEEQQQATILFSAHSIPNAMAENCKYEKQLLEASGLVAKGVGTENWRLVFQSRSGPPTQPWLEPDVCLALEEVAAQKPGSAVVIVPIGFISDHMEVMFDLDEQAKEQAEKLGLKMARAATVGTHPRFVQMIRELVLERMNEGTPKLCLGEMGPSHDVCPVDCCKYEPRRPGPPAGVGGAPAGAGGPPPGVGGRPTS